MESNPNQEEQKTAETEAKHTTLKDNEADEVEVIENKYMKKNFVSPFINQKKSWEDEEYNLPADLKSNIIDVLGFQKPSTIQSVSIPLIIQEPFHDLIAQAKNGAGKTGSFVIGSILRVDRSNPNTQVLMITHTRELCNQIHSVYTQMSKGLNITVSNLALDEKKEAQIIVSTHGKIQALLDNRKQINLKDLKCIVVDEADVFFLNERDFDALQKIMTNKQIKDNREKVQVVLFSATYPDQDFEKYDLVQKRIATITDNAQSIRIKKAEKLKLDNIKQYFHQCEKGKKIDFIKEIFEICDQTQTFIFVNSVDFAEQVHKKLRKEGFKSYIMFSKMSPEERDETMQKFRKQEINVLITTNLIARGVDVPETELVINFDVPSIKVQKETKADPATYLHRIGRAGRFGRPGVAITIWDREIDEQNFQSIVKHYDMGNVVNKFEGLDQLKQLIDDLNK